MMAPPLDAAALRSASHLLDQQMWCFGQDIRHPEGNVLLRFGFQRHRQTDAAGSHSAYVLTPFPAAQLVLWGFGLFYGQGSCGGMFLRRYLFHPVWTPHAQLSELVWEPADVPDVRAPRTPEEWRRTCRLLAGAVRWIAGYEHWVQETLGSAYRRQCLEQWKKTVVAADAIPAAWQKLAERISSPA